MNDYPPVNQETKFCSECGQKILKKAIVCPYCGCQVETIGQNGTPQVVIQNSNHNSVARNGVEPKDKWIALVLCIFLGFLGAHKFYEGKGGLGLLYIFTCGLFFIGWLYDIVTLLSKSNPYLP